MGLDGVSMKIIATRPVHRALRGAADVLLAQPVVETLGAMPNGVSVRSISTSVPP